MHATAPGLTATSALRTFKMMFSSYAVSGIALKNLNTNCLTKRFRKQGKFDKFLRIFYHITHCFYFVFIKQNGRNIQLASAPLPGMFSAVINFYCEQRTKD